MRNYKFPLAFICCLLGIHALFGQMVVPADPKKWIAHNAESTYSDGIIHLANRSDKTALLWLKDSDFKNGTIELDIKGKDVQGESFVGLAIRGTDNSRYDAIYFRPFNFRNPEKKTRSVQYVSMPDHDWNLLREQFPGKYENQLDPIPDPNDWFHVKIVTEFPAIKVYINQSSTPSISVDQLSKKEDGMIGLWIDGKDGWFKNVVISKK